MSIGAQTDTQGNPRNSDKFNLSTPAGWVMVYFIASVVILSVLFFSM